MHYYLNLSKDIKVDDRLTTIISVFIRDNFFDYDDIDEEEFERICQIVYNVYLSNDDITLEDIIDIIYQLTINKEDNVCNFFEADGNVYDFYAVVFCPFVPRFCRCGCFDDKSCVIIPKTCLFQLFCPEVHN